MGGGVGVVEEEGSEEISGTGVEEDAGRKEAGEGGVGVGDVSPAYDGVGFIVEGKLGLTAVSLGASRDPGAKAAIGEEGVTVLFGEGGIEGCKSQALEGVRGADGADAMCDGG